MSEAGILDRATYDRAVDRFRETEILLPTFAQLAEPEKIPADILERLAGVGPDDAHPLNLFRVHWYNDARALRLGRRPRAHRALARRSPVSMRRSWSRWATGSR